MFPAVALVMQWQRKTGVLACYVPCLVTAQSQTNTRRNQVHSSELLVSRVRSLGGFHRHGQVCWLAIVISSSIQPQMSTEVRNWAIVAKAMEAAGATASQRYVRAKAMAQGKLDPMPTSAPEAPYSISAA